MKRHATFTKTKKLVRKHINSKPTAMIAGMVSAVLIFMMALSPMDRAISAAHNSDSLFSYNKRETTLSASVQPAGNISRSYFTVESSKQPLPAQTNNSTTNVQLKRANSLSAQQDLATQQKDQQRQRAQFEASKAAELNRIANHSSNTIPKEWQKRGIQTEVNIKELTIKSGDSMAKLFSQLKLDPLTLHSIMSNREKRQHFTHIQPGQKVSFAIGQRHELQGLKLNINALETLWVIKEESKNKPKFKLSIDNIEFEKKIASASGIIKSSLFLAGQDVGLSEKITMELANIFGWDVDFALDIRQNDSFSILYEENYLNGTKHSDGDILAAEFTNAGKTYTAVRYTDHEGRTGYYSKDGFSLRKAFLRSPVDFARISSHFNLRRRHPILHTIRAHKGVDYAARRGTPIKAVGDGKVIHAANKGGYGKTVVLKHGEKYTTLYAHMTRFAKGIRNGQKVQQGQIIGYVGSSGLATGPHLHYEFRINGTHVNPLTAKFPKSSPIKPRYKNHFNAHAAALLAQLPFSNSQTRYAKK